MQRLELVVAPVQEEAVQDGQIPGRALGGEHRGDAPASPRRSTTPSANAAARAPASPRSTVGPLRYRRGRGRGGDHRGRPRRRGAAPGARTALAAILDRRERDGRLPATVTVEADPATLAALRAVFSARAVTALASSRARLAFRHVPPRRSPSSACSTPRSAGRRAIRGTERVRRRAELVAALAGLPAPRHAVTGAFLAEERALAAAATGDTWLLAEHDGVARAAAQ